MLHKANEDQQEILDALNNGNYRIERASSDYIAYYITFSGISFKWLHGFANGKSIKIFDDKQPEWFAKRVRLALGVVSAD